MSEKLSGTCPHHTIYKCDCTNRYIDQYDQLKEFLQAKYGEPIGSGRHRLTFASKRVVIKMPWNTEAIAANNSEYRIYKIDLSCRERLARCRKIELFGVPVIVMEKLNINIDWREKPSWSMNYDCGQVGKDRKGNLKAYDYTF